MALVAAALVAGYVGNSHCYRHRRRNSPAAIGGSACGTSFWATRGTEALVIPCTAPLPGSRPEIR